MTATAFPDMNQTLERSGPMNLLSEELARTEVRARLDRAHRERQYSRLATATRLTRRAERLSRKAERAAARARLVLARAI